MTSLAEKFLQWGATSIFGFLVATVLQPASIGKAAFDSFSNTLRLEIFRRELIPEETYAGWGLAVLSGLMREALRGGLMLALAAFAGVFVMAAHVLAREHIDAQRTRLSRPLVEYRRWHRFATIAAFGLLLALGIWSPGPGTLAISYVVLVLPALLYLGFYFKDVYHRRFVDSLVYFWVATCVVVGSLNLPFRYGEIAFDLPLLLYEPANDQRRVGHHVVLEDAPGLSGTLTIGRRLELRLEQRLLAATSAQRASARALANLLPPVMRVDGRRESAMVTAADTASVMPEIWVQHAFVLGDVRAKYESQLQPWNQLVAMQQKGFFDLGIALDGIDVARGGETMLVVGSDRRVYEIISRSERAITAAGARVGSSVAVVTEAYGDPNRLQGASCGGAGDGFWLVYYPGRGGALSEWASGLRFLACPGAGRNEFRVAAISIFVP